LFGLFVYALQGGVSGIVIKKITNSFAISAICSLFFILSTTMIARMYLHTSLAAHFTILLSIYLCVAKKEDATVKYNILTWSGLLVITALIHFYLVLMVLFFMFFYTIDDLLERKKPARTLVSLIIPSVILFSVMFIMGMFYSKAIQNANGFGMANSNLNTLFNPQWVNSPFLPNLPIVSNWQQDSFAYIGFGMTLCVIFAIVTVLVKYKKFKIILSDRRFFRKTILAILLVVAFSIFALSPSISFNDKVLFVYPVPGFIVSVWALFRATGRLLWPVVYIIMFFAIWIVAKEYKRKIAIPILLCFLIIQIYDLHKSLTDRANAAVVHTNIKWESSLKSGAWNELAKIKKHIFYFGTPTNETTFKTFVKEIYSLAKYAIDNNMTINDFNLGRVQNKKIFAYKQDELDRIYDGQAKDDTIYIFSKDTIPFFPKVVPNVHLYVYRIDDFTVGFKHGQTELEKYDDVIFIDINAADTFIPEYDIGSDILLATDSPQYSDSAKDFLQGFSDPEGWATWNNGKRSIIELIINSVPDDLIFEASVYPHIQDNLPTQEIRFIINGHYIESITLTERGMQKIAFAIPNGILNEGLNSLLFEIPNAATPKELGINEDTRRLGVAFEWFKIDKINK
jgi:hypothetical protein